MRWKKKQPEDFDDPLREYRIKKADRTSPETVLEQENEAAAMVGGKRHRGSGSSMYLKSDASSDRYQIEAKQTEKKSLGLKLEWLKKITQEAFGRGRVPMMCLRFQANNDPLVESDWVVIPKSEFVRLFEGQDGCK